MTLKVERDASRFREIVRGKIRSNLKKYVSQGEMIGRKGKDLVSIPLPQLDVPRFRHGKNEKGVGSGEGQPGDQVQPGDDPGNGPAGSDPGRHLLEVEVSMEELADILGDELGLPRIEPKGDANIREEKARYKTIRRVGPESLRHFKRTYFRALQREIATGNYTPNDPRVIPIREDQRYRAWEEEPHPVACASVIYLMDVSGSMSDEQKAIVRTEAFWIDTWLRRQYDNLEIAYIIHDAVAKEVDEHTFYHTRENGGTRISSAYRLCAQLIENRYPPELWNNYIFQFSDGDNWGDDNDRALDLLSDTLLPSVNLFCYGQVESMYGSGQFIRRLQSRFDNNNEKIITASVPNREAILDCIHKFLETGK